MADSLRHRHRQAFMLLVLVTSLVAFGMLLVLLLHAPPAWFEPGGLLHDPNSEEARTRRVLERIEQRLTEIRDRLPAPAADAPTK